MQSTLRHSAAALAASSIVLACGGGGSDMGSAVGSGTSGGTTAAGSGIGTLNLLLTDAPACGYDNVFVTVQKVRVHQSSAAGDNDAGWSEVVLSPPRRVDLLELTNGTLEPLGQTQLPAGTYTQMRLVLAANTASDPLANAIKPSGGALTALTTPSGQQSGLKMNVNIEVPEDKVADFAIDFDACKSFVKAGNSGKYLLKPVLSVIPMLSDAGQRIVGYVSPALVANTTSVSVQFNGVPVRSTPPDPAGRFVLYPVPAGTYDLVITAPGHANAVLSGVTVSNTAYTTLGSSDKRIDTPLSGSANVSGTFTVNSGVANTGGKVLAMQLFSGGPVVEVGYAAAGDSDGRYSVGLPTAAPVRIGYAALTMDYSYVSDLAAAGRYRLDADAPGFATQQRTLVPPLTADITQNFSFPGP